ncbi:MAG: anthranilate phosphoribosyltransferase [Granulosicoccus sp.]
MNQSEFMRDVVQRIATGPTLSKDLPRDDARRAMRIILDGEADDVQAAIFLIALRMKRETDEELAGILQAINSGVRQVPLAVDHLVSIVDPYDGYLRGTPAAPFLPAVLAACGLNVLSHGVLSMGPKFGASHEQVLLAAGLALPQTLEKAATCLEAATCGWAYVSQSLLAPELAGLSQLRTRIVKRPCLTTLEVATNVFTPKLGSHLVTGFVHKPYPPVYAKLAAEGGFHSSIIVRGVEGGVVPSLTQASRYFTSKDGDSLALTELDPLALGIQCEERAVPLPEHLKGDSVRSVKAPCNPFADELSRHAAIVGLAALDGEPGYTRNSLMYAAALILHARGAADSLSSAAERVCAVLDDGSAKARFLSVGTIKPG